MRFVRLVIALMLFAGCAPVFGAGLENPDFEIGPPGPGVAFYWTDYSILGSGVYYEILESVAAPWAVYSGVQSQLWSGVAPEQEAGIFQVVTGLASGGSYQASIYFRKPEWPYWESSTDCRIGIEPTGKPPTDPGAAVVWSAPQEATSTWQLAAVEAVASGSSATVVVEAHGIEYWGIVVDQGQFIRFYNKIANVPDESYPPNDPLASGDITNWCGPIAATNITWYWDKIAPGTPASGVNGNLVAKDVPGYIAWWMDTNNDGCPLRHNGAVPNYGVPGGTAGTYVADIAPGLAEYTQWDANTDFCCSPPAVPANKQTYSWVVKTYRRGWDGDLGFLWNQLKTEIDAGRPMLITWSHWTLVDTGIVINGIHFYTWDDEPQNGSSGEGHDEEWKDPTNSTGGDTSIGHITTAVGYWAGKDIDGAGEEYAATDWVIVHDTWADTGVDVAVPKQTPGGFTPWTASTTVDATMSPLWGAVTVTKPFTSPPDHWGQINSNNTMLQMRFQETSGVEDVCIDAITITASGTGHDEDDIASVDLYDDCGDKAGRLDNNDQLLVNGGNFDSNDGMLKVYVAGNLFVVPKNGTRNMIVVYSMGGTASHGETFKFSVDKICATGEASYVPITPNIPAAINSSQKKASTWSIKATMPCPCVTCWKLQVDGTLGGWVGCSPWVSAGYGRFEKKIYIQDQEPAGSPGGIQVYFGDEVIPTGLVEGATVEFDAYIDTDENGERILVQLENLSFVAPPPGDEPTPVGMALRSLGGGDLGLGGGGGGAGQKGVLEGYGLNNTGLLVRVAGSVVEIDNAEDRWFKITDGSTYSGGGGSRTVKVMKRSEMPLGYPHVGQFVAVSGICSVETSGPDLLPVVLMREPGDMQVVRP